MRRTSRPAAAEPGEPGAEQPPDRGGAARRLEEELREVRVQDLLLESVVSIINLSARRIGKEDERDLEQARIGIEAVRAVVDLLDAEPARAGPRGALAAADALRARERRARATLPEGGGEPAAGSAGAAAEPGAADRSRRPRLWTPGRD